MDLYKNLTSSQHKESLKLILSTLSKEDHDFLTQLMKCDKTENDIVYYLLGLAGVPAFEVFT